MNEFFTADTHFNHTNIIKHCARPFITVGEMNEILIKNWNETVGKKDIVYHLGDFAYSNHSSIRMELNGKIILVKGNHDRMSAVQYQNLFTRVEDVMFLRSYDPNIFLSHYAHRTWKNAVHGSWHLFGHTHGRLQPFGLSFDVGVDCWGFRPVSYDQVREKMKSLSQLEKS